MLTLLQAAYRQCWSSLPCNINNNQYLSHSTRMICEQLLGLMYGSIVGEVMANSQHIPQANDRLEKIGFRIGTKIIDQFMRDANQQTCTKLKQLADRFCTVGVKRFLNPSDCKCEQFRYRDSGCEFKMRITGNPLLNYVEVPPQFKNMNLQYQSIIKGAIRGAFQVLQLRATTTIIYESLKDKNQTIFYIELAKFLQNKDQ